MKNSQQSVSPAQPLMEKIAFVMAIALCLMPIFAALSPRFLGFAPGLMAVIGLAAFRWRAGQWPDVRPKFYAILAAGVFTLSALSAPWSFDPPDVLRQAVGIFLILGLGAVLFSLSASLMQQTTALRECFARFFPLAMIAGLIVVAADLYFEGFFYHLTREPEPIFNSSRMNRGLVTLVFMAAPVLWMLREGRYSRMAKSVLSIVIAGLLVAVLYKTQSQTAQLAAIIILGMTFLFPYRVKAAWSILGGGLIAAIIFSPWIAQMLFDTLAHNARDFSWLANAYAAERLEIWDFIARHALSQPLYGFGLEAASYIERFETAKLYAPVEHILHPHNFALQIWLEFGALGAALAALTQAAILKKIYDLGPNNAQRILPVFIAVIAAAATSYGLWQAWWLGVFTLLPVLCLLSLNPNSKI